MPTCCACDPDLTYPLATFIHDVAEFAWYMGPITVAVVLWKVCVTKRQTPRGDITVLGLDESVETYSPAIESRISPLRVLLYLLTSFVTFTVGLLTFAAVQALS